MGMQRIQFDLRIVNVCSRRAVVMSQVFCQTNLFRIFRATNDPDEHEIDREMREQQHR